MAMSMHWMPSPKAPIIIIGALFSAGLLHLCALFDQGFSVLIGGHSRASCPHIIL